MIYLDTHILVWSCSNDYTRLSNVAIELIEKSDLITGYINILELGYLYEIGRIRVSPMEIYNELKTKIGLRIHKQGDEAMMKALEVSWTRDPFDRLTVAGSMVLDIPLLTKDELIRKNYDLAVW